MLVIESSPPSAGARVASDSPQSVISMAALTLVSGNAIYAVSQLALVITVAKLGTVVQMGQFAYALATTAPIFIFSHLQLRALQATDAAGEYSFAEYFSLRLATTTIAAGLVVAVAFLAVAEGEGRTILLAMAVARTIESIADVTHGHLLHLDRVRAVGASFASRGTVGLLAFAAAFAISRSLVPAILAMAAWWLVSYVLIERRALRGDGPVLGQRVSAVRLAQLAWFAMPMGLVMALSSLNLQVPRYFVEASLGASGLGIFAGLAAIPLGGTTFVTPLCQAASARMAQACHLGDRVTFGRTLLHLLTIALLLGGGVSVVVLMFGDQLVTAIYSPSYAGYHEACRALMVWGTLTYVTTVLGAAVTAARRLRVQLPILAVGTAATAIAAMVLVPRYGLTGAAFAASAGMVIEAIWFGLILRPLVRFAA